MTMAAVRAAAPAIIGNEFSASKIGSSQRLALAAPVTRGAAARSIRVTTAVSVASMTPKALEKSWSKPQQSTTKVDAPEYQQLEDLLSKYDFKFNVGDKVVGSVFNVEQRGAYIDVGAKAAAFLPADEASLAKVERIQELLSVGETREFQIINENDAEGSLTLSLRRMQLALAWQRIAQIQAEDVTVYGEVLSANRGGLLVGVEGLRGFVPSSHLTMATPKEQMIGTQIPLKFIEADEERQRLVLSNKRAMADKQLEAFQVGDVVLGTVQSVQDYGAFVDIGGINGLLHISQISHERIDAVENVLTVGDQLKVMILSQDRERGRVSLSTRKLEPSPGDMIRDPQLVFDKADEMAATFRERVEAAEAAARAEEAALASELSEE